MRTLFLLASFFVVSCFAQATPAPLVHYTVFFQDHNIGGELRVEKAGSQGYTTHYTFKDNGRGPVFDEKIELNSSGFLKSFGAKGTSTFGAPIDETFLIQGKKAEWRSTSEKGERTLEGEAFYLPLTGSSWASSLMVSATMRARKPIDLLPNGQLKSKKLVTLKVTSKSGTKSVMLVASTGVGLSPRMMWLTDEKVPRLFADIIPGYTYLIEDGWDSSLKILEERQVQARTQMLKDMARTLQHPMPAGVTVIRNARVFDAENARTSDLVDVYVERGRITAIKPAGSPSESATHFVDARGRVISPGLYDMHGHLDRWDGPLNLAAGVTTVRDLGNSNSELQTMIDEIGSGQLLAPQVVPAGFLEGDSKDASKSIGFVIKDLEGAKHAIDWYAEHGYPQLKIYNSFPKAVLKDTVAYAHSRGMRVSGHIPVFLKAQDAVEAGYDEIQHINQVMLNFLVKPETDTRTLERFYLPAEKLADLDFSSKPVKEFVEFLKEHKTVVDPTLSVFDFIRQRDGEISEPYAPIADHMPADIKRSFFQGSMNIPNDETAARYRKSYAKMIEFVGLMYRNQIPIVSGTDALAGFTLQGELELYVKAGLTPAQALQVSMYNGAKYTRTLGDRGTLAPGKLADIVLFDGDPTKDIADVRKVAMVISRGYWMSPREIHQSLGIKPFVAEVVAPQSLPQKLR